jgi:hypothetical protein
MKTELHFNEIIPIDKSMKEKIFLFDVEGRRAIAGSEHESGGKSPHCDPA